MELAISDYKEALSAESVENLRRILYELHRKLILEKSIGKPKNIHAAIGRRAADKECKDVGTYKDFVLESLWNKRKAKGIPKTAQNNLIDFIIVLYSEFKFYANYQPNSDNKKLRVVWKNGVADIIAFDPERAIVYDCFYWRTEQSQIGVASLSINEEWRGAEMVFHYKKKAQIATYLKGKVWSEGKNLYLFLEDYEGKQEPYRPVSTLITLYASEDVHKRQYLLGCFTSVNRDTSTPVCGLIALKLSPYRSISESPYIEEAADSELRRLVNIPPDISFFLNRKRLKVAEKIVQISEDLPLHDQYDKLAPLVGSYMAHFFTLHTNEHLFKSRYVRIDRDGVVRSYRDNINQHDFDEGYLRLRESKLIVQFFDKDDHHDVVSYQYYLETDDHGHLRGVFAGASDNGIASGRIILQHIGEQDVPRNDLNKRIRLGNDGMPDELAEIMENRELSEFFGIKGEAAFQYLTDARLHGYVTKWNPKLSHQQSPSDSVVMKKVSHPNLTGSFECFCITKDTDNVYPLYNKNVLLEKFPIKIDENSVTMMYGVKEIMGNLFYDGSTKFRIIFQDDLVSLTFTIPAPKTVQAKKLAHMFGVVSSIKQKNPEASAAVLVKSPKDFAMMEYNQYHTLSDLLEVETEYVGLASFLMGDWNRFVRVPSTANRDFRPKYSTYRRTFWAAACHWGDEYQRTKADRDLKECTDNLRRAFRQAFAMQFFAGKKHGDSGFPEELADDIKMMQRAMDTSLNFDEARNLINRLWFADNA
ncbi:MAG: hypothetical protein BGO21_18445 [Dyadobacter sp. 50-39]|uniref:hypothetical protein n=1 Tax=Dyadobacter sp. 50-39 TaxID=1895756 RepID=UPI000961E8F4|nr:hypothetical protein [Dyadobacter sp. 50-39]OJV14683.1 MAG: hypothetical protein BGO21_18445 [Dyadobacter sp. 50-39]